MPDLAWTNPVIDGYLADPFILRADDRWWLIATGKAPDGRCLPIWSSRDLVHWEFVRGAVAVGAAGSWNRRNFWAPEILHHDGHYWLYYTGSCDGTPENTGNRLGVAVSDRPDGPYEDCGVLVDHASLDGSPYRAADGSLWLYYVIERGSASGHEAGRIWVDRLVSTTQVADRPRMLVGQHGWQEGPVVFPRPDGRLLLTYSLGGWTDDTYRVVQALGDAPDGPFIEQPGTIMRSSAAVKGPGHHNFFPGPDGRPWLVYHGWDPAMQARYPRIDPLVLGADGLLASAAPSSGPQRIAW